MQRTIETLNRASRDELIGAQPPEAAGRVKGRER